MALSTNALVAASATIVAVCRETRSAQTPPPAANLVFRAFFATSAAVVAIRCEISLGILAHAIAASLAASALVAALAAVRVVI